MNTKEFIGYSDDSFHIRRILELKESIIHGHFFPMFSYNQNHGSEMMTFYPYMNLFPIVGISMFISSHIVLMYIWVILNELLSLICSYYGLYVYNKSEYVSFLFAIIYSFSPLFLYNDMDDFGEVTALAVLPLVIFGCLNLIKYDKYKELSLGLTLVIYSHVLSSFIALMFIILLILLNITHFNKNKLVNLFKSACLTLLLTSIVWIPALDLRLTNKFSLYTPAHAQYLSNDGVLGLLNDILRNNTSNCISLFAFFGIVFSIVLWLKINNIDKKLFLISIIFLIFSNGDFPWRIMPNIFQKFINIFQFPQRFYIIPQLLLTYLFSIELYRFVISKLNIKCFLYLLLILFVVLVQLDYQYKVIKTYSNAPVITSRYYNHNIKGTSRTLFMPYRLKNSQAFKYILNNKHSPSPDYNIRKSLKVFNQINNNNAIVNRKRYIHIKHDGYNTYKFSNNIFNNDNNELVLPLLDNNNSSLKVYMNGYKVNHWSDKYGRLVLSRINKGKNIIHIKYVPVMWLIILKIIMFVCGSIWLVKK